MKFKEVKNILKRAQNVMTVLIFFLCIKSLGNTNVTNHNEIVTVVNRCY